MKQPTVAGTVMRRGMAKTIKSTGLYSVIQVCGNTGAETVILEGAANEISAAWRAARMVPGINPSEFANSWNVETDGCSYLIKYNILD